MAQKLDIAPMRLMKKVLLVLLFLPMLANAQTEKPKLVVGIVVDQMRQEYLYRFEKKFGTGGFKRLMNQGFMLRNAHYNYVPTYTGPGHASIYTGATPAVHGIIGNDWHDKTTKKSVNCVGDDRFSVVGADKGNGDVSPWQMLSTTITDELEIFTQRKAKVVGLSIKDRGAVLPTGHTPDGAYWYDDGTGKFISSTYYKPGLPYWLEQFNGLNLPDKYLNGTWNTLLPIDQYKESGPDDTAYEEIMKGKTRPVFPYNLAELRKVNGNLGMLPDTPFGNDFLTEGAKAAIAGESLGADDITDFLSVSYSTPDYIGHSFGPNSIEVQDTYLRLDRNIEDLLNTLDKQVGAGNYTLFLTADHAVAEVPRNMMDWKIPGGYFDHVKMEKGLQEYLNQYFPGVKIIEEISNQQVFLDHTLFGGNPKTSGVDLLIATQLIARYLMSVEGVSNVYTESTIQEVPFNDGGERGMVARGYHPKRSGDLAFTLESNWFSGHPQGSTHGSAYKYDTHVPVLFFGKGINIGVSDVYHPITDIAPTLSILMKIKFPSGCSGQPVAEAIKK
jgi:predicted AlkP superfamily pyrophosphatase or phosphodiesterase